MKNIILLASIIGLFTACSSDIAGDYGNTTWESTESLSTEQLVSSLIGKDSVFATVNGTIGSVCQAKGCWMAMNAGEQEIFVKFKDYGFFVPMNSATHEATMQGWAYADTVSVKDQIEYAKDAEATEEEIAAITEPEVKLTFMAEGVVIK
jgi:hypothetical protein